MPKTKSGKPIPYKEGGTGPMYYSSRTDAEEAAYREAATVQKVDSNGDGNLDSYVVVARPVSVKKYFEKPDDVDEPGNPNEPDDLGYMQGGMGFTERGPIKYSKGGAARGKAYSGSY